MTSNFFASTETFALSFCPGATAPSRSRFRDRQFHAELIVVRLHPCTAIGGDVNVTTQAGHVQFGTTGGIFQPATRREKSAAGEDDDEDVFCFHFVE
jgi:hypothetical protein